MNMRPANGEIDRRPERTHAGILMRLRDKNKEQHERSVANGLLNELGIRPEAEQPGNPTNGEPDRLYSIDKKTIGIEVVTAYYAEHEAKATAKAAAEKPIASDEIRVGEVSGSPDDSICASIQEALDVKCGRVRRKER